MQGKNTQYAFELITKATRLRKIDINESIKLLEEAIPINKKVLHYHYDSLAVYYFESNNKEKAYSILFYYLKYLNSKKFYTLKGFEISSIYHRICILLYIEGKYREYIYYYTLMSFHVFLSIFTMGRVVDFRRIKRLKELYGRFKSMKVKTCFKRINKLDVYDKFSDKFDEYFKLNNRSLMDILQKSHEAALGKHIEDGKRMEHSNMDKQSNLLNKDDNFLVLINKLGEDNFLEFYNSNLKEILEP